MVHVSLYKFEDFNENAIMLKKFILRLLAKKWTLRKWPYQGEGHRLCQISQNDSDIMNLCAKQVSSTVQNITLVLNPAIF